MLTPDFTFHHRIIVRRWLRRDISEDVYAPPETLPCRVDFKRKTATGGGRPIDTATVTGTVFLAAGARVGTKDLLFFAGSEYHVIACRPCFDMYGAENHVELDIV